MAATQEAVARKARQLSSSVYPEHEALLYEIRMKRAANARAFVSSSEIIQEAIVELARRELDPVRFEELMAGAS